MPLPSGPIRSGIFSLAQRGEEPLDDADPVAPEVDEQCDRGGDVQPDDERQVGRLVGGHVEIARPAPPDERGISTLCPRLDTGNSSVTPWIRPTTAASR